MAFQRGGQAAEQASKAGRKSFSRVEYFSLGDGEKAIIRLLDDSPEWLFAKQHNYVPTKDEPEDWGGDKTGSDKPKWPTSMSATCRKDPGIGADTCYICDNMTNDKGKAMWPATRLWVRAVLREEVRGTQAMADAGRIDESDIGRIVGYRDLEHDVEETDADGNLTGKTVRRKRIVLINQGVKNFFGALQGYYDMNGTVLDRDYQVVRKGEGKETEYRIMARDPLKDFDLFKDKELRAKYEGFAAEVGLSVDDVEKMVAEKGSEEFYARFFDPTAKVPPRTSSKTEDLDDHPGGLDEFKPRGDDEGSSTSTEEKLAEMRRRMRESGRKAEPSPA